MRDLVTERCDRIQKEFKALLRRPGESIESYITRAYLLRRELLRQDKSFQIGERFFVSHLLDGAEITSRDRAMVVGASGTEM